MIFIKKYRKKHLFAVKEQENAMINCVISYERDGIALGNILSFLGKCMDKNWGLRYDIGKSGQIDENVIHLYWLSHLE